MGAYVRPQLPDYADAARVGPGSHVAHYGVSPLSASTNILA
jgi:hypothetical protein